MPESTPPQMSALSILGALIIVVGLLGIVSGSYWSTTVFELVDGYTLSLVIELFVPFLPIFMIIAGAALISKSRN
ncbi:MAG: hypothetical protein ACR2P1_28390 [Pseudomonadales bacterium]